METIGVKQFRDQMSRILKRVENGEMITVVRHGKKVVELRPAQSKSENAVVLRLKNKKIAGGGSGKIATITPVKNLDANRPVSDYVSQDRR